MDTDHTGILFALAATVSWSIGIFPFTEAARRLGVNPLNHFRLCLASIFLLITSLFISSAAFLDLFSGNYYQAWMWFGLSGIVGLAMGDYFAFGMYAILGAKTGSVLTTFAPAAALLFGKYILDEKINVIGVAGIAMTIFGVISISLGRKERSRIPSNVHGHVRKGIVFGILAAMCQGAGLVFAKKGFLIQEQAAHAISPVNATFLRMLVSVLVLVILTLLMRNKNEVLKPLIENREGGIKYAVAGTFFGPFVGVCLSLITITRIDVAVAQTIFSFVPALALLISFFLLKEKMTYRSVAGILIAISGVVILIWRNLLMVFLTG